MYSLYADARSERTLRCMLTANVCKIGALHINFIIGKILSTQRANLGSSRNMLNNLAYVFHRVNINSVYNRRFGGICLWDKYRRIAEVASFNDHWQYAPH